MNIYTYVCREREEGRIPWYTHPPTSQRLMRRDESDDQERERQSKRDDRDEGQRRDHRTARWSSLKLADRWEESREIVERNDERPFCLFQIDGKKVILTYTTIILGLWSNLEKVCLFVHHHLGHFLFLCCALLMSHRLGSYKVMGVRVASPYTWARLLTTMPSLPPIPGYATACTHEIICDFLPYTMGSRWIWHVRCTRHPYMSPCDSF